MPLPLNLFYPRWLIDGPSVLCTKWEIRLDLPNYNTLGSRSITIEERYASDKFVDQGGQVILDAAFGLAKIHKQLPPKDAL